MTGRMCVIGGRANRTSAYERMAGRSERRSKAAQSRIYFFRPFLSLRSLPVRAPAAVANECGSNLHFIWCRNSRAPYF